MKRIFLILYLFPVMLFVFPDNNGGEDIVKKLKTEILKAEKNFEEMAAEKGVAEAFYHFAAEDAVIMRNHKIFKGKAEIKKYFDSSEMTDIELKWKPDYIDVSASGDMAYTYGKFSFSAKDKAGKLLKSDGIFHTVWKRQADGQWKYVWD